MDTDLGSNANPNLGFVLEFVIDSKGPTHLLHNTSPFKDIQPTK